MKKLTTVQQMKKMNRVSKLGSEGSASKNIVMKLGGIALYAGIADYLAIQSARLLEQILLKEQLSEGKKPSFLPHDDCARAHSRLILRVQSFDQKW